MQITKANAKTSKYDVEYTEFLDAKNKPLAESGVETRRIRNKQGPANKKWKPATGEVIEVLEDDCWWEGRVIGEKTEKKVAGYNVKLWVSDQNGFYPRDSARPSFWWSCKK